MPSRYFALSEERREAVKTRARERYWANREEIGRKNYLRAVPKIKKPRERTLNRHFQGDPPDLLTLRKMATECFAQKATTPTRGLESQCELL